MFPLNFDIFMLGLTSNTLGDTTGWVLCIFKSFSRVKIYNFKTIGPKVYYMYVCIFICVRESGVVGTIYSDAFDRSSNLTNYNML